MQTSGMRTARLTLAAGVATLLMLAPAGADAQAVQAIDVPAQPLGAAISELSQETGLSILARRDLVAGRASAPVRGAMSPREALEQMIVGSGLSTRALADGSLVLTGDAAANHGPIALEQIIVQGELQARTVQDTTTSVAVITGEALERRSDEDLVGLIERTPGISRAFGDGNIVIRGIEQNGVGFGSNGGTVTVNIDGARVNGIGRLTGTPYSTWDLQQVEVLRGPQSTQTGRNALAGALIVRSNDPTYDLEFRGRGAAGNFETLQGAVVANVPVVEDRMALRVAVDHNRSDRFIENPFLGIDDQDSVARTTLRAGLRLEPTDAFSAILKFTRFDEESGQGNFDGTQFPESRVRSVDIQERLFTDLNSVNLRMSYDMTRAFRIDTETNFFESHQELILDPDNTTAPSPASLTDTYGRNFEQEVQLVYEGDRLRGVLGGFVTDITENDTVTGTLPAAFVAPAAPPGATATINRFTGSDTTNYAAFGEVEYRVLPDLRLIAGARYDRETVDAEEAQSFGSDDPAVTPLLPQATSNTTSASFDAFLPKLGLVYDVTDDISLGATVQRGYRAGGSRLNLVTGLVSEFDPEFTWNYEVALRSQWLDDRLTVNANAFYTDWRNQQVQVFGASGSSFDFDIANAGASRVFGGEIEARAQPLEGLEVFAALAYADTAFTDFVSLDTDFSGNEFPFASKITAAFGAEYIFESGIFLAADASFTDAAFSDIQNTPDFEGDSRFLVNSRLGYDGEHWGVFGYVTNLFDEDYVTRGLPALGLITAGEPRQFGIVGQIRF